MKQLLQDGVISEIENEDCYARIDFSRSFCSKSGDLISYFYRKMNGIRSLAFSNLEAIEARQDNLSERALVILDDHVGTGYQFLSTSYRQSHADLFNRYGKVYVATLIANNQAILTFKQVNQGNYETLVRIECGIDGIRNLKQMSIPKNYDLGMLTSSFVPPTKTTIQLMDIEKKRLIKEAVKRLKGYQRREYGGGLNL